ncbi:hypothetical protein AHF37_11689 [Paragonimus kellicotti]|nr:hypothetical protein AHF37_11689 [Paragonimus kellicotti]
MDFQFNEECINEHNCLRRLHGCPPLKMDIRLAQLAQSHAMKLASSQTVKALGLPDAGENFYLHIGSPSISGESSACPKEITIPFYGCRHPSHSLHC